MYGKRVNGKVKRDFNNEIITKISTYEIDKYTKNKLVTHSFLSLPQKKSAT